MSSGAVVGTISTTSCEPLSFSSAASLASSAAISSGFKVPEVSITRAVNGGTGCTCCAPTPSAAKTIK